MKSDYFIFNSITDEFIKTDVLNNMKKVVNQKAERKRSKPKFTTRRKQAIKLEIKRIKELELSGEETFLIACSLINMVFYLNQKIDVDYSKK